MKVVNIGRGTHNDIIINDEFVSKSHLQLVMDDNGNFTLKDLGSRNGTFVNGQRVNSCNLNKNDIIRIGNETLPWTNYFVIPEEEHIKPDTLKHYAGFWLRFVAYLLDSIIVTPLILFAYIIYIGLFAGAIAASYFSIGAFLGAIFIVAPMASIITWLYFSLMESSSYQATLGKMAVSIIVTDLYGNRISFLNATGRFFGKILSQLILYFGFFMAGWTEKKQALHDMMANTLVVKKY